MLSSLHIRHSKHNIFYNVNIHQGHSFYFFQLILLNMVVCKAGRVNQSTVLFFCSIKFISKNILKFGSTVNFCDKIELVIEMTTLQT